jgi:predicted RNA-binding Zn ribbon-like protein
VLFSHDTERALSALVDLVNTGPAATGDEHLRDLVALQEFVDRNDLSDACHLDATDLESAVRLRDRFQEVFESPDDTGTAVVRVNAIIAEAHTTPHLTNHDGYDWHVHFFAPGSRLAEHLAAECGIALAYVVAGGELDRLRVCEAPGCSRVLVDLSRNRCRRYCDSRTCGNRMHVAAYRARQRESAAG